MTHCSPLFSFETMETCEDGDDLVFFYQVCAGVASASHASHTATQAGLPDKLVARAKEVMRSSHPATTQGAHVLFDPDFFSSPTLPTLPSSCLFLGFGFNTQWKTHHTCHGAAEGEPNGKVSVRLVSSP